MRYTKVQRHRIYKKALYFLKNYRPLNRGFCFAITIATDGSTFLYPAGLLDDFPELVKPKVCGLVYWYPLTPNGRKKRLAILRKAIKETNPKPKKK